MPLPESAPSHVVTVVCWTYSLRIVGFACVRAPQTLRWSAPPAQTKNSSFATLLFGHSMAWATRYTPQIGAPTVFEPASLTEIKVGEYKNFESDYASPSNGPSACERPQTRSRVHGSRYCNAETLGIH